MEIHPQSFKVWAIILTVLHTIAILSTLIRFAHRHRIGRVWFDDYIAMFVVPVDLLYLVVLWLRYRFGTPQYSIDLRVALYFLSGIPFFIIVWGSRMSIALSIVRVLPEKHKLRRVIYGLMSLFAVFCLALCLQAAVYCGTHTEWHKTPGVQCNGTIWITSLTFDLMGDLTLVGIPIAALFRSSLPRTQRQLVHYIFSASILTCLTSIATHIFILGPVSWGPARGQMVLFFSHIEATTCLMVSNILTFVALFYSRFHNTLDLEGATVARTAAAEDSITRASYHPGYSTNTAPKSSTSNEEARPSTSDRENVHQNF
ncbi:hypothetical protein K435DRAFT_782444 [Dendrothele bispora CBS 962.96]|uniref:Rhodopsin domain-containing protein n=1 Tax=Dendrothele bispora (strain CBS 962.96) TaxID=1314807 RepID=A0A4S8LF74_DENBC|nr:hypothetical protein K435DRAFT_782444 [Dendrothele bispora CBS 962.96]